MAHPGDLSELERLIVGGTIRAADVTAIIGKTEGNGGVNDFTRGYFTQTLMALLSQTSEQAGGAIDPRNSLRALRRHRRGDEPALQRVLRQRGRDGAGQYPSALAIGTAFSAPVPAEDVGRRAHVESVAGGRPQGHRKCRD